MRMTESLSEMEFAKPDDIIELLENLYPISHDIMCEFAPNSCTCHWSIHDWVSIMTESSMSKFHEMIRT